MEKIKFSCPACKKELEQQEDAYSCAGCNKRYSFEKGVPVFRDADFYWGVVQRQQLRNMIEAAQKDGWKKSMDDYISKDDPAHTKYLLDETRFYWHLLLPLSKQSRVLDLGCGWGCLSFPLAKEYDTVVALDSTKEKVQFNKIRAQQSGIKNLIPVCADALNLPFSDDYFDLVVVYGVMEWLGLSGADKRPEFYQLEFLKEARRVLKPGGHIYLAIENRFAVVNFLGAPDPHTNLKFITLLPRFLANIYSKLKKGKPYREYTHSLGFCKKLFRQAGFSRISSFSPLPSYRKFWYILPLDSKNIMLYFLNYLSTASTPLSILLLKLARFSRLYNVVKYFVSDFSFILRK